MTPVSPFLSRSALALVAGMAVATSFAAISPATYFDTIEWRLADLPGGFGAAAGPLTPARIVTDLLMAGFFFLLGKELWETLTIERSALSGRNGLATGIAALGGLAGAALTWMLLTGLFDTAQEAHWSQGWMVPLGSDVVLAYAFGRKLFGSGHAALQVLLFVTIIGDVAALLLSGLAGETVGTHWPWLLAAAGLPLAGWFVLTRPAAAPGASERIHARAHSPWPWAVLGLGTWAAVAAAGLPPAAGLLPLLPAMPRPSRSFGLFAQAEGFLTDPANRLAHLLRPATVVILFLFGLTHGALDAGAAAPTTWVALGALWLGKPLGLVAGFAFALRVLRLPAPAGLGLSDLAAIAALAGIGFTSPALVMEGALPGGEMQEAARLGLALSLIAGPAALTVFRRIRRHRQPPRA